MLHISSKDNNTVKHVSKLIKSSAYRSACNEFVIEGMRLCIDALESGVEITMLAFSQQALKKYKEQADKLLEICESTFIFSDKLFSQISDTKSPQGVLCVCKIDDKNLNIHQSGVYLALEHIQDPSNMGTILRTAEALGVRGVVLTSNCCDVYSPKVLRGTMGAVFRMPVMFCDSLEGIINICHQNDITTIATIVSNTARSITKLTSSEKKHCLLIIGNEGNGIVQGTIDKCRLKVTIPMLGRAESLNASVAAAISMWEILRGQQECQIL